ncbi:MAG: hydroxyethylthiazole kinase, partial [Candidatus Omnitrophica bacterium]|nr:hydroxyethylthiazole kinase [Candidatus Omnitrophota bacterium]
MLQVAVLLEKVRTQKPLVHHITNWVTIYDCANIVKAFGASPVMAHAGEEAADMTSLASALVLNIGTLTKDLIVAMERAVECAGQKKIPVVLDVCGAGATRFRDDMTDLLLNTSAISVIKGNASEIARVAGYDVKTRGVDSGSVDHDCVRIARDLALRKRCVVVVTGAIDIVAGPDKMFMVKNGHVMMSHVVGTGCMAASVIGTFSAVADDVGEGAAAGLCCFGIASALAA